MKKLFIILCAAVMLCSCSEYMEEYNELIGSDFADDYDDDSSDESSEDENIIPDGFSTEFENAYYTTSGGKNYILIEAAFTNESEATMAFNEVYTVQAFQNGVGLTHTNNWNAGKYDMTAYASALKPGYSTNVYIGFEARTDTENVYLECTPAGGGNVITQTLNLTKVTVETTTETTTRASVIYVQPPAAPAPSYTPSSTGYTCRGRTMQQAYDLMTSSEKAIVNNSSSSRELVNAQYAKHGYCFQKSEWHIYFYGYDH